MFRKSFIRWGNSQGTFAPFALQQHAHVDFTVHNTVSHPAEPLVEVHITLEENGKYTCTGWFWRTCSEHGTIMSLNVGAWFSTK